MLNEITQDMENGRLTEVKNITLNGYGWIPRSDRKNILLLSDDLQLRLFSGIGTMSRQFVLGTAHRFNWYQIGAAINHPDLGKRMDISEDVNKHIGINDSQIYIQPYNGYGDPDLVRSLMSEFKFDALMHFTDPRQFIWLYQMAHEIRQQIPILYYNIWDNLPYPMYNKAYYESCDALFSISRQTFNINKVVLGEGNFTLIRDDNE